MRKVIFLVVLLYSSTILLAQVPQSFNYQAVARNSNGEVIANKTVVVEINILKGSQEGTLEYQEIHNPTTNDFGLFSLQIGKGQTTFVGNTAQFTNIAWEAGNYYLKVRVDFGDANYLNGLADMGTAQLQAVPYSLLSQKALEASTLSSPISLNLANLADVSISNPQQNQSLIWNSSLNKWTAGATGSFIDSNGSTDLSGDWAITTNNISLLAGNLTLGTGNFSMSGGSVLISGGSLTVIGGLARLDSLQLEQGVKINKITNDGSLAGNSNTTVPTEQAVRTYVANAGGGTGGGSTAVWFTTTSAVFISDSRFVGVGTSTPSDKVHFSLAGQEGFLVSGIQGGAVPNLGVGTRLAFYPAKAAFRAGTLTNLPDAWNDVNTGLASTAFGQDNIAAGDFSFAAGNTNSATGNNAVAFGLGNTASGSSSSVFGYGNLVKGNNSFSCGIGLKSNTYTETSFGIYNFSSGTNTSGWSALETLFSVGNGTSDATRSNAFVITKYGGVGVGLGQQMPSALFQVGTAGNGTSALANSWNTFSDRRLKRDFAIIENPIGKIGSLNGYYYHWKTGKDTARQVGVVAQEVLKTLPEIVSVNSKGIYSVDYSKFSALLIESTKAQQKEIKQLEKDNENLTLQVKTLETELAKQNLRIEMLENFVKAEANIKMNKK